MQSNGVISRCFERQDFLIVFDSKVRFPAKAENVSTNLLRCALRDKYRGKFAVVKDPRNVGAKRPVIRA